MKFGEKPISSCLGDLLVYPVRVPNGKLPKGTKLSKTHLQSLRSMGIEHLLVASLQKDDIDENLAANLLSTAFYKKGFKIIGSAHNQKELDLKIKQGCKVVIYSRLFKTNYPYKSGYLGIQKFNIISLRARTEVVPLGGINAYNLSKLKSVLSHSFACLSAIKKKPAKLINRLF